MKLFELLSVDNHIKIEVQRTHRGGMHFPFPMIIPRCSPIHDFHYFVED